MSAGGTWQDEIARFPRHWIWDREPVYHIGADEFFVTKGNVTETRTRCGLVLTSWDNETGDFIVKRETCIRRSHADKFARPCRRCVPA